MLVLIQRLVRPPEEITDCTMVGHQVVEVFVRQFVGLIVLELPEEACSRLQLREAGTAVDLERRREGLDLYVVLDVIGIALDELHPDGFDDLLCLLYIDEQLCVLFDNVEDLTIEVVV